MEGNSVNEENDILMDKSGIAQCIQGDELKGVDGGIVGEQ